jgi:hypothetical protein
MNEPRRPRKTLSWRLGCAFEIEAVFCCPGVAPARIVERQAGDVPKYESGCHRRFPRGSVKPTTEMPRRRVNAPGPDTGG